MELYEFPHWKDLVFFVSVRCVSIKTKALSEAVHREGRRDEAGGGKSDFR